jgi:hypothetical protein
MHTEGWPELEVEHSGEHNPSLHSLQTWHGTWEADPHVDRLFGPGCEEQSERLMDQTIGTPVKERTVYEISEFCALLEPVSAGWQLQDIFATPQQRIDPQPGYDTQQQHSSPPELSSDLDDDQLLEVTLKSNALRALREADLCGPERAIQEQDGAEAEGFELQGPALMEDVTTRVAEMHVDPKTGIMSKLMGMFSPSLLGFPTNSSRKKKTESKKMAISSRHSERPATRTSTMMTTRRAQMAACKQLGLIQREEEFTDEVLAQYLALFRQPLSSTNLQGLAALADMSGRPSFVLPEGDMAELLSESPYAT